MKNIRVFERDEEIISRTQEPLNPHPQFPQWSTYDIYPNSVMGTVHRRDVKKTVKMVYLENEFLTVCIAPDIGGRVWSIYDKISKRHAINYSPQAWMYSGGFGLNYTSAGLEINYPLAHSCTTSLKREYRILNDEKDSVSVVISEMERVGRTRWFVTFRLRSGRSYLEQTVRVYNPTPVETRYMYWSNCGFLLNDDVQYIFPEPSAAMHGQEHVTFSWPMWKNKDLSFWKNVAEPLGLYMLDAQDPYFGYYDHSAKYGMVHYADLSDLPGKKSWSWGASFLGRVSEIKVVHPGDDPYGEMQAGRVVIQEHTDRLPPESECQWTEYWYPVRDTGVFNGVGRDVTLKAEVLDSGKRSSKVMVTAIGSGTFPNAKIVVERNGHITSQKELSLDPRAPVSIVLASPLILPGDPITVSVINDDGEILGCATLREPSTRDSWTEIVTVPEGTKTVSAEEVFQTGCNQARDWGNHDERLKYEETLKIDPGFSSAHLEIGKLDTIRGDYTSAAEHLKAALQRSQEDLNARYYLGVALALDAQEEAASRSLELAARYDTEMRSRTRLAEIAMRRGDYHHALRYLDRVTECAPRLTRPKAFKAICLRQLGRLDDASKIIESALKVDPTDPFLWSEFFCVLKASGKGNPGSMRDDLKKQTRGEEPPLLDAAFAYGNVGRFADAIEVLGFTENPGSLSLFYRAWLEMKLGLKSQSKRTLKNASKSDPTYQHAWGTDMIPVLEWAIAEDPKDPRPHYHLGNLLVARRRLEEGVKHWRLAEELGDLFYLLYSNLGYYELKIQKDSEVALKYFEKASELMPKDLYMLIERANLLKQAGRSSEAVALLEQDLDLLKSSPTLTYHLMTEYIKNGEYLKFDSLAAGLDFSVNWILPGPHSLWYERHVKEGLEKVNSGVREACLEAVELFDKALVVPANLGIYGAYDDHSEDERTLYHKGRCHEKLGNLEEARRTWQRVVGIRRSYAWEMAFGYLAWQDRYFQALAFKKLGDANVAEIIFDGMELLARGREINETARKFVLDLVTRGRFGEENTQDPYEAEKAKVDTRAEL